MEGMDKTRNDAVLALQAQLMDHPWRHVNGHFYDVLMVAVDDDMDEIQVIHRGQHDGRVWSRCIDNFAGYHVSGVKRFQPAPKLDRDLLWKAAAHARSCAPETKPMATVWKDVFNIEEKLNEETLVLLTNEQWHELANKLLELKPRGNHG